MGTYIISDIHGEYTSFMDMLSLINFSKEDTLYVVGDTLDRGPNGLKIIEYIRKHKNIIHLRGNHEDLLLNFLTDGSDDFIMKRLWVRAGGGSTIEELKTKSQEYIDDLVEYLSGLEYYEIIDNYLLVHAGVNIDGDNNTLEYVLNNSTNEHFLWDRAFVSGSEKIDGYTVICGHTPVREFGVDTIYKRDGLIVIDCGCSRNGKLACLRLEDLKEYYV